MFFCEDFIDKNATAGLIDSFNVMGGYLLLRVLRDQKE